MSALPPIRTFSVRAKTTLDLLSLSKQDFDDVIRLYPDLMESISLKVKKQWTEALSNVDAERQRFDRQRAQQPLRRMRGFASRGSILGREAGEPVRRGSLFESTQSTVTTPTSNEGGASPAPALKRRASISMHNLLSQSAQGGLTSPNRKRAMSISLATAAAAALGTQIGSPRPLEDPRIQLSEEERDAVDREEKLRELAMSYSTESILESFTLMNQPREGRRNRMSLDDIQFGVIHQLVQRRRASMMQMKSRTAADDSMISPISSSPHFQALSNRARNSLAMRNPLQLTTGSGPSDLISPLPNAIAEDTNITDATPSSLATRLNATTILSQLQTSTDAPSSPLAQTASQLSATVSFGSESPDSPRSESHRQLTASIFEMQSMSTEMDAQIAQLRSLIDTVKK